MINFAMNFIFSYEMHIEYNVSNKCKWRNHC